MTASLVVSMNLTGRFLSSMGKEKKKKKLKSRVQDPALSQAELLKVITAFVPIRLAGDRDTETLAVEQDRAAEREQIEGIVNERARAEITR